MTEPNTFIHVGVCRHCGKDFEREIHVRSATVPVFCSKTCKRVGSQAKAKVKTATAEDKATRGMSPTEKSLYRLMQANRLEPTTAAYDENLYRESGGYKPRKPVTQSRPKNEFEVTCPHPYKLAYRTFEEAQAFIDRTHPEDEFLAPYTCRCGGVHIGHSYPRSHPLHPGNLAYAARHQNASQR